MENYENMLLQLIERAKAGKPSKFQFIRSWQEYIAAKKIRKALRLTIKGLKTSATRLLKTYCQNIKQGTAKAESLLAYSVIQNTYLYYKSELDITEDMIWEYEMYLLEGNFLESFFGVKRPEEALWDHRGLWRV